MRSEAQRRAQQAVGEAMQSRLHPEADDEQSDEAEHAPPPCDVGLVFALGIESGGLVDLLSNQIVTRGAGFIARRGTLDGRQIVVIESGVGEQRARKATDALLAGHHPQWIISAGFAGGLDPTLAQFDLLVANSVANEAGQRLAIDLKLEPTAGMHVGRLLSTDHIVHAPDERAALRAAHDALAVDMESFAVAEACQRARARFLCIRAISDTADQELPADLAHLMNQTSLSGQAGAVLGSVFRRPKSVKDMWRLREDALVASDRLAQFLRKIIVQLAPEPPHETPRKSSSSDETE